MLLSMRASWKMRSFRSLSFHLGSRARVASSSLLSFPKYNHLPRMQLSSLMCLRNMSSTSSVSLALTAATAEAILTPCRAARADVTWPQIGPEMTPQDANQGCLLVFCGQVRVEGGAWGRAPRGCLWYGSIRAPSSCLENARDEGPPKEKRPFVGYILFSFFIRLYSAGGKFRNSPHRGKF